jgi:hypothetical protein
MRPALAPKHRGLGNGLSPYSIRVRYRTRSGTNAVDVTVDAPSDKEALRIASDRVRAQRGVVRVDGAEWSAS